MKMLRGQFLIMFILISITFTFSVSLEFDKSFIVNLLDNESEILDIASQNGNVYLLSENGLVYFIDSKGNINKIFDLELESYGKVPVKIIYNGKEIEKYLLTAGGIDNYDDSLYVAFYNIVKVFDSEGEVLSTITLNNDLSISDVKIIDSKIFVLDQTNGLFKVKGNTIEKVFPERGQESLGMNYTNLEVIGDTIYLGYMYGKTEQVGPKAYATSEPFVQGVYKLSNKDGKYMEEENKELGENAVINESFVTFENHLILSKGEAEIFVFDEDLNIRLYINSPNLLYYPKFALDENVNADGKNILYIYNHRDLKRYFFEFSLPQKICKWETF
ncbi:MAG TPA: hypothetical protein DEA49_06910 [Petrotoga sp.]|nr:hypothetical protein [Petrotoga sp.]